MQLPIDVIMFNMNNLLFENYNLRMQVESLKQEVEKLKSGAGQKVQEKLPETSKPRA